MFEANVPDRRGRFPGPARTSGPSRRGWVRSVGRLVAPLRLTGPTSGPRPPRGMFPRKITEGEAPVRPSPWCTVQRRGRARQRHSLRSARRLIRDRQGDGPSRRPRRRAIVRWRRARPASRTRAPFGSFRTIINLLSHKILWLILRGGSGPPPCCTVRVFNRSRRDSVLRKQDPSPRSIASATRVERPGGEPGPSARPALDRVAKERGRSLTGRPHHRVRAGIRSAVFPLRC